MPLILHSHPFSSYSWKALIALYANDIPFTDHRLEGPEDFAALRQLWPAGQFPVLVDGERVVPEATAIIDYLAVHCPGPVRLIPADPEAALEVRLLDRIFDNHVQAPMQKIVGDALRPEDKRDPLGVAGAREKLEAIYPFLNARLEGREWAAGAEFSLADCAAAPALFYADWVHPIPEALACLRAYRARLNAHPVIARVIDEARPYRPLFPLGAPDRD